MTTATVDQHPAGRAAGHRVAGARHSFLLEAATGQDAQRLRPALVLLQPLHRHLGRLGQPSLPVRAGFVGRRQFFPEPISFGRAKVRRQLGCHDALQFQRPSALLDVLLLGPPCFGDVPVGFVRGRPSFASALELCLARAVVEELRDAHTHLWREDEGLVFADAASVLHPVVLQQLDAAAVGASAGLVHHRRANVPPHDLHGQLPPEEVEPVPGIGKLRVGPLQGRDAPATHRRQRVFHRSPRDNFQQVGVLDADLCKDAGDLRELGVDVERALQFALVGHKTEQEVTNHVLHRVRDAAGPAEAFQHDCQLRGLVHVGAEDDGLLQSSRSRVDDVVGLVPGIAEGRRERGNVFGQNSVYVHLLDHRQDGVPERSRDPRSELRGSGQQAAHGEGLEVVVAGPELGGVDERQQDGGHDVRHFRPLLLDQGQRPEDRARGLGADVAGVDELAGAP
mmetsp:Transcript_49228/g.124985  ORF Transcript_49228/g.124985 Transcript_49228/m.124985 type:complete len:452 (+) Transcript_49228:122-1477(+)